MKRIHFLASFLIIFSAWAAALQAAPSVAFGYFVNKSGDETYDYLENVLPKTFASTMKNKHKLSTIRPERLKFLYENNDPTDERKLKTLKDRDLPVLTESLGADFLVTGSFVADEEGGIKLKISIYKTGTHFIFSFSESGNADRDLFRLVDRVALRIKQFVDYSMVYKKEVIGKKTKVAIISNVEGDELNSLYYGFLSAGHRVSMMQGNELQSFITDDNIKRFFQFQADNISFDFVGEKNQAELMHGTWSGTAYYRRIIEERETYRKYCTEFARYNRAMIKKLSDFDPELRYIILIGFDDDREEAWYRCIDIKTNRLISMEYGIEGDDVAEITQKILTSLNAPPLVKN